MCLFTVSRCRRGRFFAATLLIPLGMVVIRERASTDDVLVVDDEVVGSLVAVFAFD
jgi:hypothetical protein